MTSTDKQGVPETTICAESVTETLQPLPEMRWRGGKLQQQWQVETRGWSAAHGLTIHIRRAWKDVPEVAADAE